MSELEFGMPELVCWLLDSDLGFWTYMVGVCTCDLCVRTFMLGVLTCVLNSILLNDSLDLYFVGLCSQRSL